jgi:hypothetical protein
MKANFDRAFELVIGLEGAYTDDPDDPGGPTKYGIAQNYNPEVDVKNLTLERAKEIYYRKYWLPAGCNEAMFPMDICLFDSNVNPQRGGNQELLNMKPKNWQEYMIFRMQRYMKYSKAKYVKGHIFRVLKLCKQIKEIEKL